MTIKGWLIGKTCSSKRSNFIVRSFLPYPILLDRVGAAASDDVEENDDGDDDNKSQRLINRRNGSEMMLLLTVEVAFGKISTPECARCFGGNTRRGQLLVFARSNL